METRHKLFILTGVVFLAFVSFFLYEYGMGLNELGRGRVLINGMEFGVEIADNPASRIRGLSGRDGLGFDEGMLFIFDTAGNYGFWMNDMAFPIDIIWISGGRIVGFAPNLSPESFPEVFYPPEPADRVLEAAAGTVEKKEFKIGDTVKLEIE